MMGLTRKKQGEQEWGEEDWNIICFLINVIENYKIRNGFSSVSEQGDKAIDWLKSPRSQSQWMPSDEQMEAINTAINVIGKGTLNGKQLIKLQEQLKKLRGE